MTLINRPLQVHKKIPKLFEKILAGQAPPIFNRQFLKDLGFTSSNDFYFIPMLKELGFLNSDGSPTEAYKDLLDETRWRQALGAAVRSAYEDIFIMKAKPTDSDLKAIKGKFKSTFNTSDVQSDRAARTFLALLQLCGDEAFKSSEDLSSSLAAVQIPENAPNNHAQPSDVGNGVPVNAPVGLHYNIQIHLPPTKDIEVYNAIFKSLKEHLID